MDNKERLLQAAQDLYTKIENGAAPFKPLVALCEVAADGVKVDFDANDLIPFVEAVEAYNSAPAPQAAQTVQGDEPEAHKLARILMGMVAGVEDYTPAEIYRDGYSCSDGDVFVHRAADLLAEQAAEISEMVRHYDSLGDQYAELKEKYDALVATSPAPAVVQMTDEQLLRLRACIETGVALDIVSCTDADVILSASGVKHG